MSAKGRGPTARSMIREKRNKNLGWATALGEWIDNSCGNGAKTVTVRLGPKHGLCQVSDDGNGCTEKMFAALQSFGWHEEDDANANPTSVYGIGAKDGFLWAGGQTELYSLRDTARFTVIDWDSFGDDWDYPDPMTSSDAIEHCHRVGLRSHGTVIRIPRHNRNMNRTQFESLLKALDSQHWAAVESGVVIRVEFMPKGAHRPIGRVLTGKAMPEFIEGKSIDLQASLADGRQIRIVGGVLAPTVRLSDPGFEYVFGHRVVVSCGSLGAGQLGYERVYFRVFLQGDKGDWTVNTNKDGLHDGDEAALGEAVFRECRSLLETAQSESIASFEEQELESLVSGRLTQANRKRAKRRAAENESGTVESTGEGGKHRNAKQTSDIDGNCKSKRRAAANIQVKLIEFDEQSEHLAARALVKDRIVRLNKLHPAIAACVAERAARELFVIANSFWAAAWIKTDDKGSLLMPEHYRATHEEKYSAMLADVYQTEAVA